MSYNVARWCKKCAALSQTVFMWSINEAYGMDASKHTPTHTHKTHTHTHTHGRAEASYWQNEMHSISPNQF